MNKREKTYSNDELGRLLTTKRSSSATTEYEYDSKGNQTKNLNKGKSAITYNDAGSLTSDAGTHRGSAVHP